MTPAEKDKALRARLLTEARAAVANAVFTSDAARSAYITSAWDADREHKVGTGMSREEAERYYLRNLGDKLAGVALAFGIDVETAIARLKVAQ